MYKRYVLQALIVIVIVMMSMLSPFAQEAATTIEATETATNMPATEVATETPVESPPKVAVDDNNVVILSFAEFLLYIVMAIAGGATGVSVLLSRIANNKDALDSLERVALNTVPAELLSEFNKTLHDIERGIGILQDVTDGEPNVVDNE